MPRKKKISQDEREEILNLALKERLSYADIGRKYDVSGPAIRYIVRREMERQGITEEIPASQRRRISQRGDLPATKEKVAPAAKVAEKPKRGTRKKEKIEQAAAAASPEPTAEVAPVKRRPGRPRKQEAVAKAPEPAPAAAPPESSAPAPARGTLRLDDKDRAGKTPPPAMQPEAKQEAARPEAPAAAAPSISADLSNLGEAGAIAESALAAARAYQEWIDARDENSADRLDQALQGVRQQIAAIEIAMLTQ